MTACWSWAWVSIGYYLSSYLDFLGLQYISAGLERLILFLYPTMTVILSAVLYKRAIGRKVIAAMALCYAGIVLVFLHDMGSEGRQRLCWVHRWCSPAPCRIRFIWWAQDMPSRVSARCALLPMRPWSRARPVCCNSWRCAR